MGADSVGMAAAWTRRVPEVRRVLASAGEAWRARTAARRAPPAPQHPPAARLERSRAGAALEARAAVRAGVRLDDFLRCRLARYAAQLPVPLEALPVTVDVEEGEPVVRARPRPPASAATLGARGGEPRWVRSLLEREGAGAVRELREAEAALDALDGRAAAARARIEEVRRALADDLARGRLTAPVQVEATAEQLGRPPVPPPWPMLLARGFALALLAAETWRLADPILGAAGISSTRLSDELQRAPLPAGLALAFALGAAGAVFALLRVAVGHGAALAGDPGAPSRRGVLAAAAAGAAALAAAVACVPAAPTRWAEAVLLVVVPLAAVLALRHAAGLAEVREAAEAAALAWDRERAREMVERGRRAGVVAEAERALAGIEAERAEVRRRLRALERRAVEAHQAAEAAAAARAAWLERLSEALAAALELDRYAFLRHAARAGGAARAGQPPAIRLDRPVRLEPAVGGERLGVVG